MSAVLVVRRRLDRLFHDYPELRGLVPDASRTTMRWLAAKEGDASVVVHPTRSVLLVLRGAGRLGDGRHIATGDVLAIAPHARCEVMATDSQGIELLAMTFQVHAGTVDETTCDSLEKLLELSEARATRARQGALYALLEDGSLSHDVKRKVFLTHLRRFSDVFQRMLFTRQGTCAEPLFEPTFLSHFRDELGHNAMLAEADPTIPVDAILNAAASWFPHQMLQLDNVEKLALVHLVLETAGHHFHTLAKNQFPRSEVSGYFDAHADHDFEHSVVGLNLLAVLTPTDYQRLHVIVDEGWDMFELVGARIGELVRAAGAA